MSLEGSGKVYSKLEIKLKYYASIATKYSLAYNFSQHGPSSGEHYITH
jgi:hypothetical protein